MVDCDRIIGLFREKGFVFQMTVNSEDFMYFAVSSDSETEDDICMEILKKKYKTLASIPNVVERVALRENAECVVVKDGRRKAARSKTIDVTLNPLAFDIRLRKSGAYTDFVATLKDSLFPHKEEKTGFVAVFPSEEQAEESGTGDFLLVYEQLNRFWDGSNTLDSGYSIVLAPDINTYETVFSAETARLKKAAS